MIFNELESSFQTCPGFPNQMTDYDYSSKAVLPNFSFSRFCLYETSLSDMQFI